MRISKKDMKALTKDERIEIWALPKNHNPNQMSLDQFLKSDTMNVTRKNDAA